MSPEVVDVLQGLVVVLVGGGAIGGFVSIWTQRHKPPLDRQAANDATRKSYADTFASEVTTLRAIIDELNESRTEQREVNKSIREELNEKIEGLRKRIGDAEQRAREAEKDVIKLRIQVDAALPHIIKLEEHIRNNLPPPPPARPF